MPLAVLGVALITYFRRRRARRDGVAPVDHEAERRRSAAQEMERRMAAYLAGRDMGVSEAPPLKDNEQETTR